MKCLSSMLLALAAIPAHADSEVEEAIAHAHSTYHAWRLSTFEERAAILRKVADLMRQRCGLPRVKPSLRIAGNEEGGKKARGGTGSNRH